MKSKSFGTPDKFLNALRSKIQELDPGYETHIVSADEIDEVDNSEYDLPQAEQKYSSAKTSINSTKLPAIYKMINFTPGTVGIDYGGGKFDNARDWLAEQDVELWIYDPYNRTSEENRQAVKAVRQNGGADFAICSNVLNVIAEDSARLNVLRNIKNLVKSGGDIYITVYEGKGNAKEGETKSGYQRNRKTADYLDEIQQIFPDARRRGKLIQATNSGSENVESSEDIIGGSSADTVRSKIERAVTRFMVAEGFPEDEVWDYVHVDVANTSDGLRVEVRAELTYDSTYDLAETLNQIVSKYDPDAYFDMVEAGIIEAFIRTESVTSASFDTGSGPYWYFTRHGVMPGSVPKDINILDIVDEDGGSYFLSDKVIDTNDLREYEIKEKRPESIESAADITAAYDNEVEVLTDLIDDSDDEITIQLDVPFEFDGELEDDVMTVEKPAVKGDFYLGDYVAVYDFQAEDDIFNMIINQLPEKDGTYHVSGTAHLQYVLPGTAYDRDTDEYYPTSMNWDARFEEDDSYIEDLKIS